MGDEKSQGRRSDRDDEGRGPALPGNGVAGRVLCIGGAVLDTTFVANRAIVPATSNPAIGSRAFGGVARNVAENLARLGIETTLLSRVGDDANGHGLKRHLDALGIDTGGVDVMPGWRTAEYMALLEPDRTLSVGVADMAIFDRLDVDLLADRRLDADGIFVDCNCTPALLSALLDRSRRSAGTLAVDTVSVAKAERLPARLDGIDLLFLNLDEAASILRVSRSDLAPDRALRLLRDRGATEVVLTLGSDGLLAGERSGRTTHVAAVPAAAADVTGAGDALIATTLAMSLAGLSLPEAARWGCLAATLTLETVGSTRADLSLGLLRRQAGRLPIHPLETSP